MKLRIVAVAVALVCWAAVASADQSSSEAKARELLELTGAGKVGIQVLDGMLAHFRTSFPDVPDEFWTKFRRSVKAEEMVELLIPIYVKHIPEKDLEELVTFFKSPVGRRFAATQPLIVQDSMAAGAEWGERLAQRAVESMRQEGLLPKS